MLTMEHSGVMGKSWAFSVPAKKMAMWLFIIALHGDFCRLPGGLWSCNATVVGRSTASPMSR